jgi:hypothetical protein
MQIQERVLNWVVFDKDLTTREDERCEGLIESLNEYIFLSIKGHARKINGND